MASFARQRSMAEWSPQPVLRNSSGNLYASYDTPAAAPKHVPRIALVIKYQTLTLDTPSHQECDGPHTRRRKHSSATPKRTQPLRPTTSRMKMYGRLTSSGEM